MYHNPLVRYTLTLLSLHLFLQTTLAHPPSTSPPSKPPSPQQAPPHGLSLIPNSCQSVDLPSISTAINDAQLLARAALTAASNPTSPPFSYFFATNVTTVNTVTSVLRNVQSSLSKKGDLINATCTDTYRQCQRSVESLVLAYTANTTPPLITLCALGLSLPRNPPPCSPDSSPDTISLGFILLHEITHVPHISGSNLIVEDLTGRSARDVNNALIKGVDTTRDANAYAHLGSMAWDLGLGLKEGSSCVGNFSRANFDAEDYAARLRAEAGVDGLRR